LNRLVDHGRELAFHVGRVNSGYLEIPIARHQIPNLDIG
jgi:hypothetical protein